MKLVNVLKPSLNPITTMISIQGLSNQDGHGGHNQSEIGQLFKILENYSRNQKPLTRRQLFQFAEYSRRLSFSQISTVLNTLVTIRLV